jgi:3',5'-cyclic-AMP phosphodiesterase
MLIAQITDTHITLPGELAYGRVDTAEMLRRCVGELMQLDPRPELVVHTGDLVDHGLAEEYAHLRAILAPLPAPLLAIPGNHDAREAMRAAFAADGYLPRQGFLQFEAELGGLRFIGLDTLAPGQGAGELCGERLAWLDATLGERPEMPTLVLMHHPPFLTGIAHMDRIGLAGREAFAELVCRHAQIEAILCGHVHRPIHARVGGRAAIISPSPAHQIALDLRPEGPSVFRLEPPGYMLHRWQDRQLVSLAAVLGDWPGPYRLADGEPIGRSGLSG